VLEENNFNFLKKASEVGDYKIERTIDLYEFVAVPQWINPFFIKFPIESCGEEYKNNLLNNGLSNDIEILNYITSITDSFQFELYFNQISSNCLQQKIIESFFLNTTQHLNNNSLLFDLFDIIKKVLSNSSYNITLNVKAIIQYLNLIGIDENLFNSHFSNEIQKSTKINPQNEHSKIEINPQILGSLLDELFSLIIIILNKE
jgi:hypothetical protein